MAVKVKPDYLKGAMMSKSISYNDSIEELESIIGEIENETVDVDILAKKVRRAIFLIKLCRKKLRKTDTEVKKVLKEFESSDDELKSNS